MTAPADIELSAIDLSEAAGHPFKAWLAAPEGIPKGAVVVLQEIFGVTEHIKAVVLEFASQGYLAIAPSMFDYLEPGVALDYDEVDKGRSYKEACDPEQNIADIKVAVAAVAHAGKVGAVGYCWGGGLAYLAACEAGVDAAVAYYGANIALHLEREPRCPVMYHFGALDPLIPMSVVDNIQAARPDDLFHIYPHSGHGFNCTDREDYNPEDAATALDRTRAFFGRHLN